MTANTVTKDQGELFWALLYGLARAEERDDEEPEIRFDAKGRIICGVAEVIGERHFHKLLKSGFPKKWVLERLSDLDEWPRYYQKRYSAEYAAFCERRTSKAAPRPYLRVVK